MENHVHRFARLGQSVLINCGWYYILSSLFAGWLYFDMIRIGVIPLFDHMERYAYTADYAGASHRWLMEFNGFLCLWWGIMFAADKIRNGRFDIRYLGLLGVLFVYYLLTGHRFSAYFVSGAFFAAPMSAAAALGLASTGGSSRPFTWAAAIFSRQQMAVVGALLAGAALIVSIGLYTNLTKVRSLSHDSVGPELAGRILVQPSELSWISYERTFVQGQWNPAGTFDFLFVNPIEPTRNTTPQYLMNAALGEQRAAELIHLGNQFAGGFPEIFFELLGPIWAWPLIVLAGCVTAGLMALLVRSVIQGRYATAFLAAYVLYGFQVMYIGGMLNFVTVWTYWVKIMALAGVAAIEYGIVRNSAPLIPWLIPLNKAILNPLKRMESASKRA